MPIRRIDNIVQGLTPDAFRAFFNSVHDYPGDIMSFSIDTKYRYVSFNKNYQKYLKKNFDINLEPGDSMIEIFEGYNDLRKEIKNFKRAFSGTEFSQIGQYSYKQKTNFYKDIYKPVFNAKGEVIGVTVFYTNITQRKQSERAWEIMLNISERVNAGGTFKEFLSFIRKELGKIINTSNFFVALYNPDNKRYSFPYYSDRYDDLDSYKYYDLSKSITDYVRRSGKPLLLSLEKEQQLISENKIELFGTHAPSWMGIPLKTKDRIIGVMVVQDYDRAEAYSGKDLELMASVSDHIANSVEKKRTERILEETARKLRYAQDIAKLGHLELDLHTEKVSISDAAAKLLHINPQSYKRVNDLEPLVEKKDRHLIEEIAEKLREKPDSFVDVDFRVIIPDTDEHRYFNTKSELIKSPGGKPVKVSTIIQDVTEQQKDKLELKLAKEKAEESDKLKSAFLANMSHEIRTPMNAILGFSKLLSDPEVTSDTREKYAGYINSSANNLLKLINDIIDVAKIEAGQLSIRKKVVDIHTELDEILEEFKQQRIELKKDHVDLRLRLGSNEEDFYLNTDQLRFRQIFTNLLGNAMKFTDKGYIEFGYKLEKGIQFYVKDTGTGIPPEKKELVFSRFGQVIDNEIKHPGGTGLGLSITKHLVERLGGNIRLESEFGKGSEFKFSLPLERGEGKSEKKQKTPDADPKKLQDLTILVVEDNKVNQILVKDILNRWAPDNTLIFADNGKEATKAFHKQKYDIIFMDIKLPDNDGFELTSYLRNIHTPNINTPVIGLSAHAMKEYKDKSLSVGMNDFLTKPFVAKDFFATLSKYTKGDFNENQNKQQAQLPKFKYVDLSILQPIYDLKPERMKDIIRLYSDNISNTLILLETKLKEQAESAEISKVAHTLKSSLRYLGLNDSGNIAFEIEKEPKEPAEEKLEQILNVWKKAKEELESLL